MSQYRKWIEAMSAYAEQDIIARMPANHHFHNIEHVRQVVQATGHLAGVAGLEERERTILTLAAWFHDLGYADGAHGHEDRGADIAQEVMGNAGIPQDIIDEVKSCILATRMPQQPTTHLQKLMADADLSHLGTDEYWIFISKLRQELKEVHGKVMDEKEWLRFEINFMEQHEYFSQEGLIMYGKTKKKHLRKLRAMLKALDPTSPEDEDDILDGQKLGRGVETLFRSAYRTHINLSSIADNKANIMLSINAIIISIVLSALIPRLSDQPNLFLPTLLLLSVCLTAIIFATMATMPKVTKGSVSKDAVLNREANLIFFGNFYNMSLKDYQWGMNELIEDKRFIYNTMTRDLYFLGIVLAKKYALLRWCYIVFMWGLIAVVIAFAIAFFLQR